MKIIVDMMGGDKPRWLFWKALHRPSRSTA